MKIALAQIKPVLGDVEKNLELHLQLIKQARQREVDILVFPELSLTGYLLRDLVEEVALQPHLSPIFKQLLEASEDLIVILGFVEEKEPGIFFNSAACLGQGQIFHLHRKVYLPTYGMFEEGKFFAPGRVIASFDFPFGRAGLLICYDFLNYGSSYALFSGGADYIFVVSAAPGRGLQEEPGFASQKMWELMGETISFFSSAFVFYCNRVGFEDGKGFAGGSFIYNPHGKLIARAPDLEEHLLIQEINPEELRSARRKRFYRRDNRPEVIWRSLEKIIEHD
jgi:predicted amidohydrolase